MGEDEKLLVEHADGPWAWAAACNAQGKRERNEDVHVMLCGGLPLGPAPNIKAAGLPGLFDDLPELVSGPSLPTDETPPPVDCLFAVFDGHAGDAAARACAARIPTELREELEAAGMESPESRKVAVEGTFLALDRHLRVKLGPAARHCGTTCIFCYAWKEKAPGAKPVSLLLANLGDSRALVLRKLADAEGHELMAETSDHKPDAPEEKQRILAAGGTVEYPGKVPMPRVDGLLGCSRSLGDNSFKEDAALPPERQKVSTVPDINEFACSGGDAVVLACDGVFDVLSSRKVCSIVSQALSKDGKPAAAASAVVRAALSHPMQQDNVTCVVALIK